MSEKAQLMTCLDADQVTQLIAGELSDGERAVIERHLDACHHCRAWMAALGDGMSTSPSLVPSGLASGTSSELPAGVIGQTPTLVASRTEALARGTRVGRYTVIDMLGAGAMATVYAAYDPELDRTVALKIVSFTSGDGGGQQAHRLIREAKLMARLSHANVVTVYDAGRDGDHVFIAMERIDGVSLRQWLAQPEDGRPRRDIVRAFVQAGRGLAAAHAAGIIHRDFKPDNVLIDAGGVVRVTDFGLAHIQPDTAEGATDEPDRHRALSGPGAGDGPAPGDTAALSQLTRSGAVLGTPAYMAPEQRRSAAVDGRSDQYSYCVALAEALVGQRPVAHEDAVAGPGRTPLRGVPRRLARVLARGLAPNPDDRFATMEELLAHLQPRRWRWLVVLAAALFVFAAAVALWAHQRAAGPALAAACDRAAVGHLDAVWNPDVHARIGRALAVSGPPYAKDAAGIATAAIGDRVGVYAERWIDMRRQTCRATEVRGEQSVGLRDLRMQCLDERLDELQVVVGTLLAAADDAAIGPGGSALRVVDVLGDLDQCADLAALRWPADVAEDLSTSHGPARQHRQMRARELRRQLAEARALIPGQRLSEASARVDAVVAAAVADRLAVVHAEALRLGAELKGRMGHASAEDAFHQALDVAERAGADAVRADALIGLLAISIADSNRFAESLLLERLIYAAVDRLAGEQTVRRARVAANLSGAYGNQGQNDQALMYAQRARELFARSLGAGHPYTIQALTSIAIVHHEIGAYDQSLVHHQRALEEMRAQWGPQHPMVADQYMNIGLIYLRMERIEKARELLQRAVALWEQTLGPTHPAVAGGLRRLAFAFLDEDPDYAKTLFTRAVDIAEQSVGADNPALAPYLAGLGASLFATGESDDAIEVLRRSLALWGDRAFAAFLKPTAQFFLAQALWQQAGSRAARARALELARAARAGFAASPLVWMDASEEEVAAWLHEREMIR